MAITHLIDPKLLRIAKLFLKDDSLFHLQRVSKEAKVPIGTTFRLMPKLVSSGLVEVVTVGKIKLYKTNKAKAKQFGGIL